jgi:hypothetical protein
MGGTLRDELILGRLKRKKNATVFSDLSFCNRI